MGRIAFVVATLLVSQFAGRAIAMNAESAPPGAVFERVVPFARSELPLPAGRWEVLANGETFSSPHGGQMRSRLPFVSLVQISEGRLVGLVQISGTYQQGTSSWARDTECDRTDHLYADVDRNLNNRDQWCFYVSHMVRSWVSNSKTSERYSSLYARLKERNIRLPATMLTATARRVMQGEFVEITYEIDPVAFGGPAARRSTWETSEWHPQNIAEFPYHRTFADDWIAWSKPVFAAANTGFRSTLADYVPRQYPVAGPSRFGIKFPAVGTKFETKNGGFVVTAVDGLKVTTSNANNVPSTWHVGGILTMPSNAKYDAPATERLFPLNVGNRIEFDQASNVNGRGWRHSVEVVRREPRQVNGRDVETFVIIDNIEATDPVQGGFRARRTYWYAPEFGWLVKMHSEQLAGPPETMNSWEVVRVLPPG